MSSIWDNLIKYIEKHGWQIRMLSVEHLQDLQDDVQMLHSQDLFDEEFFQERLSWFRFRIPADLPKAKSLIVVAVPRPQSQAVFNWKGEPRVFTIPPTYVAYDEVRNRVEDFVTKIMSTEGYYISRTRLPLKLLAVRSGLGLYGRNNICYVPGMGSFLQIVAVYSDMPCVKETWQKVQMMERCQDCCACRLQCPTNAISSDRFLLHAERCLVFHNE
jgi:epoxyqueuosine reductase